MDLSGLGDRAFERGRLSVSARLRRLQVKAWMIGQCALAAGVAWVVATELFGHGRPREEVTREFARRLLRFASDSAQHADLDQAATTLDRARETEALLDDLQAAASEGLEVVRSSSFRRGSKEQVRSIAEVVGPLDRAMRNTRVLIRRVVVSARLDETMPPDYLEMLDGLAGVAESMADEFAANRPPDAARPALLSIAERSADASEPLTLSAAVVLGQLRSLVIDLLELSGLTYSEAIARIPARP